MMVAMTVSREAAYAAVDVCDRWKRPTIAASESPPFAAEFDLDEGEEAVSVAFIEEEDFLEPPTADVEVPVSED